MLCRRTNVKFVESLAPIFKGRLLRRRALQAAIDGLDSETRRNTSIAAAAVAVTDFLYSRALSYSGVARLIFLSLA
jgi:hypothetical protein